MNIGYDIDGVVIKPKSPATEMHPLPQDFLITGRSYINAPRTRVQLEHRGVQSAIYFNPVPSREVSLMSSNEWKSHMLKLLNIGKYYEDNPETVAYLRKHNPGVEIIHVT